MVTRKQLTESGRNLRPQIWPDLGSCLNVKKPRVLSAQGFEGREHSLCWERSWNCELFPTWGASSVESRAAHAQNLLNSGGVLGDFYGEQRQRSYLLQAGSGVRWAVFRRSQSLDSELPCEKRLWFPNLDFRLVWDEGNSTNTMMKPNCRKFWRRTPWGRPEPTSSWSTSGVLEDLGGWKVMADGLKSLGMAWSMMHNEI